MTALAKLPLNLLFDIFEQVPRQRVLLLFETIPSLKNALFFNEEFWRIWYSYHYPDSKLDYPISTPWRDLVLGLSGLDSASSEDFNQEIRKDDQKPALTQIPGAETASICNLRNDLKSGIAYRDTLESYASMYSIPYLGVPSETLIDHIEEVAPCDWISSVERWAQQNANYAEALNTYSNDMTVIQKVREGKPLTISESYHLRTLGEAIQKSPRPDFSFVVYRGNYSTPGKIGDVITTSYPTSGSFSFVPIYSAYMKDSISKIYISQDSVLSYHPAEDQVIFPTGAQFKIVSGPTPKSHLVFGEHVTSPEYELDYIGVSAQTHTEMIDTSYSSSDDLHV